MDLGDYQRELEAWPPSSANDELRVGAARAASEEEIRETLLETPDVVLDLCDLAREALEGELDPIQVFGSQAPEIAANEWKAALPAAEADPVGAGSTLARLPLLFRHFEPWIERLLEEAVRIRDEGFDETARMRHGDPQRFERQVLRLDAAVAKRNAALEELFEGARAFVGVFVRRVYVPSAPLAPVVEAGEYGLRVACRKFDHSRGYRLTTYAAWWIFAALEGVEGVDPERLREFREELGG